MDFIKQIILSYHQFKSDRNFGFYKILTASASLKKMKHLTYSLAFIAFLYDIFH